MSFHGCEDYSPHRNSTLTHDGIIYSFSVNNTEDAIKVIELMAQIASQIDVTEDKWDKAERDVQEEFWIESMSKEKIHERLINSLTYEGTQHGKPSGGTKKSLERCWCIAAANEFYRNIYIPSNMALIVVGDMPSGEALYLKAMIRNHFGKKERKLIQNQEIGFPRYVEPRFYNILEADIVKSGHCRLHFNIMVENRRFNCEGEAKEPYCHLYLADVVMRRLKRTFASKVLNEHQHHSRLCSTFTLSVECESTETVFEIFNAFVHEVIQVRLHGISEFELREARHHSCQSSSAYQQWYIEHFMLNDFSQGVGPESSREVILAKLGTKIDDVKSYCKTFLRGVNIAVIMVQSSPLVRAALMKNYLRKLNKIDDDDCHFCWCDKPPGETIERVVWPVLEATELTLSNGMRIVLKRTMNPNDQCHLNGFAFGGLSEVLETDHLSCAMSARIGDFILRSRSGELSLLLRDVNPKIVIDQTSRYIYARFSPSDIRDVLKMVYLLFSSNLEPTGNEVEVAMGNLRRAVSDQSSFDILTATRNEINSGGSYMFKRTTVEDLSRVNATKAWNFFRNCFLDPSNFRVVLCGSFEIATIEALLSHYLAIIPRTQEPVMKYGGDNVKPLSLSMPRTVIMKEVSSSRSRDRMMCCISFPIQLNDYETTEDQRYQLAVLRYVMHTKANKVVCFEHKVAETVITDLHLPDYSNVGAYSFSFFLKDSSVVQTIIDAVVAGINQLQQEGPSEHLTEHAMAMLTDWNEGSDSSSEYRRMTHLCFTSTSCHRDPDSGHLKMGEISRRNNRSFNSQTFKALFRKFLHYPCKEAYTVVKVRC